MSGLDLACPPSGQPRSPLGQQIGPARAQHNVRDRCGRSSQAVVSDAGSRGAEATCPAKEKLIAKAAASTKDAAVGEPSGEKKGPVK